MKVAIKDIKPNPFRHLERYPIDKNKVTELKRSIKETGWWGNIVGRKCKGGGVEIAYGHHRLAALKKIHGEHSEKEVSIIIETLDDTKMLKMMANENMEQWGRDFSVQMETVRAVVEAYGDGKIELPAPAPKATHVRIAPHFKKLSIGGPMDKAAKPYTAKSVAQFLGWTQPSGQPNDKTKCALGALELIEESILKDDDFRGLSTAQAKAVVKETGDQVQKGKRWVEGEEKAEKAGDKNARADFARTRSVHNATLVGETVSASLRSGSSGAKQANRGDAIMKQARLDRREKDPMEKFRDRIENIAKTGSTLARGCCS